MSTLPKVKIIDTVSTAKIYINDQEIDGVAKYKIKRKVHEIPTVTLTIKPCYIDMDLSDTMTKSRLSLVAPQLRNQIWHIKKFMQLKKLLRKRKSK